MSVKTKMMYPNQKMITICDNGAPAKDSKQPYSIIDNEIKFSAMRDLKPTSYIMWEYICSNQRGFDLLLSRVDVMNQTGISSSSYDSAIKELKEKNYLIPKKEGSNTFYCFYARPYASAKQLPTPKVVPFILPSPASEEEDYKRADVQPLRPQVRERKTLTTDAICSLLAEEC